MLPMPQTRHASALRTPRFLVEDRVAEFILLVEDEEEIRDLVKFNLEREGYRVSTAPDGEEGLRQAFETRPDLIVLDIMLPTRNGLEILRELRNEPHTQDVPVLLLTARSTELDKLLGFEYGADDYISKPFSVRELLARVRAVLRRSGDNDVATTLEHGLLQIDLAAHEVCVDGKKVVFTRREFDLLTFLVRHAGRVLPREELLRKVWGYDFVGESRTVDVHIRRVRVKLGKAGTLIETVPGVGYRASRL